MGTGTIPIGGTEGDDEGVGADEAGVQKVNPLLARSSPTNVLFCFCISLDWFSSQHRL